MDNITPILGPVLALLRSRKFLLAFFGVVQTVLFQFVDVQPELWQAIDALVMVLITMIAVEDAAEKLNK